VPDGDILLEPGPCRASITALADLRNDMREKVHRPIVAPPMRGVHHLALCTDDMKATIDFYVDVLGMPLVHAMKVPHGLGTGPGNRGNPRRIGASLPRADRVVRDAAIAAHRRCFAGDGTGARSARLRRRQHAHFMLESVGRGELVQADLRGDEPARLDPVRPPFRDRDLLAVHRLYRGTGIARADLDKILHHNAQALFGFRH
jgi:catechol 2,3-dioxygenase-like lactoylglutathione lyase family enzyme